MTDALKYQPATTFENLVTIVFCVLFLLAYFATKLFPRSRKKEQAFKKFFDEL